MNFNDKNFGAGDYDGGGNDPVFLEANFYFSHWLTTLL